MTRIHIAATAALLLSLLTPAAQAQQTGGHSGTSGTAATQQVAGSGTVRAVDPAKRSINLRHDPIQAIGWPAMTMDFAVAQGVDLSAVKPGQAVEFSLVPSGNNNYAISSITPKR